MRTAILLTITTCLLGIAGLAHAGPTLASPAIFGSLNQDRAVCFIRHIGTTGTVAVEVNIFDESGNVVPPVFNTCTDPLTAGDSCLVDAVGIPFGVAHACSARVLSGNAKNVRGTLSIVHDDPQPRELLRSAELR